MQPLKCGHCLRPYVVICRATLYLCTASESQKVSVNPFIIMWWFILVCLWIRAVLQKHKDMSVMLNGNATPTHNLVG